VEYLDTAWLVLKGKWVSFLPAFHFKVMVICSYNEYTRRARDARANSRLFAVHTGRRMVRRSRVRRA